MTIPDYMKELPALMREPFKELYNRYRHDAGDCFSQMKREVLRHLPSACDFETHTKPWGIEFSYNGRRLRIIVTSCSFQLKGTRR